MILRGKLTWRELSVDVVVPAGQDPSPEVLAWLHEYYRGDRRRMSEELDLSYSHLSALVSRTLKGAPSPQEEIH